MAAEHIYDIIIIGAGPAGLTCGRTLLDGKCTDVLLLDKIAPWEHPVPCAEGVGKLGFHEAGPIDPHWIRQSITTATFHAPSGSTISYTDKNGGYIIDRARMQKDIAGELATGGFTADFSCRIRSIEPGDNNVRSIITADGAILKARVVVDASGPINCFAKNEPIAAVPGDLEPAYFMWVEGFDIDPGHIHIFAGQQMAPGGYAWIFPRGTDGANIGVVLGRSFSGSVNIVRLLDDFIQTTCPSVKIMQRFAGAIPCGYKRSHPITLPRLIKTGDAACTVNPISRAGITEAMHSGILAGKAALAMLQASTKREFTAIGKAYERSWNTLRGNRHLKLAKVKNALLSIPDDDYNRGAEALAAIPPDEVTMSKIFRASLSRFPRLMWAMRHLM